MGLVLKINKVPLELGRSLPNEALAGASVRKTGLLSRLLARHPLSQTVYAIDDCELEGLDDTLCIYPCTHRYLNRDRQWHTRATLFLHQGQLQRILFQIVGGQTAALNFLERFEAAAINVIGEPCARDRRSARWIHHGTQVATLLHRDRINADIVIELAN